MPVHVDDTDAFYEVGDPFLVNDATDPQHMDIHSTWTFTCRRCGESRPMTNRTLDLIFPVYARAGMKQVDICHVGEVVARLRKQ